jgi:hypothetical protein
MTSLMSISDSRRDASPRIERFPEILFNAPTTGGGCVLTSQRGHNAKAPLAGILRPSRPEQDAENAALDLFGALLTAGDHKARMDTLLNGAEHIAALRAAKRLGSGMKRNRTGDGARQTAEAVVIHNPRRRRNKTPAPLGIRIRIIKPGLGSLHAKQKACEFESRNREADSRHRKYDHT